MSAIDRLKQNGLSEDFTLKLIVCAPLDEWNSEQKKFFNTKYYYQIVWTIRLNLRWKLDLKYYESIIRAVQAPFNKSVTTFDISKSSTTLPCSRTSAIRIFNFSTFIAKNGCLI